MSKVLEQIKAVVIGHAVGDALGVPVEFCLREELDADPVTDMRGYGTHSVPAGTWSDDTSMSLAALDVLSGGEVDHVAVMRNFTRWLNEAEFTATGCVFDVGGSCRRAVWNYMEIMDADGWVAPALRHRVTACGLDNEHSNGNGSLMRIHPYVLYARARQLPFSAWKTLIEDASRLTHAHERSRVGCLIYAFVLMHLLESPTKASVSTALRHAARELCDYPELDRYGRLFAPDFANIPRNGIKSSGYVVHTLEAAIWCLLTTDSYAACVLKAVNLGEDTDTVAAVAGGLAGALYGYGAIPKEWLNPLLRRDYIEQLCHRAAINWR